MYLIHHGIKGQQWGVRNGPPYPIDDKVLRKGTRLKSVSSEYVDTETYRKSGRPIYTYNPNDEWDNKVYKGPFAVYNVRDRGAMFVREHEFEVVKDLKMPTRKERVDELMNLYNDPKFKKSFYKELEPTRKLIVKYNVGSSDEMKVKIKDLNLKNVTDKDSDALYEVFGHQMEDAHRFKTTREYMNRLQNKWDAMVDDNNVNIYNRAHDPVVIFKAEQALRSIEDRPYSETFLSMDEIMKNHDDVKSELEKHGERVKY